MGIIWHVHLPATRSHKTTKTDLMLFTCPLKPVKFNSNCMSHGLWLEYPREKYFLYKDVETSCFCSHICQAKIFFKDTVFILLAGKTRIILRVCCTPWCCHWPVSTLWLLFSYWVINATSMLSAIVYIRFNALCTVLYININQSIHAK